MTKQEFHECLAAKTGDDIDTIERIGFELHAPAFAIDRKELKRQRRLNRVFGSFDVSFSKALRKRCNRCVVNFEMPVKNLLRQHVATELSRVQASLDGLMVDRPRRNLIRRNGGQHANRD